MNRILRSFPEKQRQRLDFLTRRSTSSMEMVLMAVAALLFFWLYAVYFQPRATFAVCDFLGVPPPAFVANPDAPTKAAATDLSSLLIAGCLCWVAGILLLLRKLAVLYQKYPLRHMEDRWARHFGAAMPRSVRRYLVTKSEDRANIRLTHFLHKAGLMEIAQERMADALAENSRLPDVAPTKE